MVTASALREKSKNNPVLANTERVLKSVEPFRSTRRDIFSVSYSSTVPGGGPASVYWGS